MSPLCRESVRSSSCQMRVLKRILVGTVTAITLLAPAACDTLGVTLLDPNVASRPDTAAIHVRLEDSALARVLGWTAGVPRAVVMLQRIGEDYRPDSMLTDSTGRAYIDDLLPGFYRVAVHRLRWLCVKDITTIQLSGTR